MLLQIIYFSCVPYNNVMKKYSKGLGEKEEKDKFKAIRHAIELISLPPPLLSVYCLVSCNIKYLVIEYIQTVDYSNIYFLGNGQYFYQFTYTYSQGV